MNAEDQLEDGRNLPIFIHSELDDLGLTSRTFRVYAHLARRAGRGNAWPSYNSIGQVCFSPDLPTAQPGTWRRMAIQAVKELAAAGLITKETRQGVDGNNRTNIYKLTPKESWVISALSPGGGSDNALPSDNAPKGTQLEITQSEGKQKKPPQQPVSVSSVNPGESAGSSGGDFFSIVSLYEKGFALTLSPLQAEMLGDLLKDHGVIELTEAIRIASSQRNPKINYIAGICRRRANGEEKPGKPNGKGQDRTPEVLALDWAQFLANPNEVIGGGR